MQGQSMADTIYLDPFIQTIDSSLIPNDVKWVYFKDTFDYSATWRSNCYISEQNELVDSTNISRNVKYKTAVVQIKHDGKICIRTTIDSISKIAVFSNDSCSMSSFIHSIQDSAQTSENQLIDIYVEFNVTENLINKYLAISYAYPIDQDDNATYGFEIVAYPNPSSSITILPHAFDNRNQLISVNLGNRQINSIGEYAFSNCVCLESIAYNINSNIASIGNYAFYNCQKLNSRFNFNKIEQIGDFTFYLCLNVNFEKNNDTIEFHQNLIGNSAFVGCSNLNGNIEIYNIDGVKQRVFSGCNNIRHVTIYEKDATKSMRIQNGLFYYCRGLSSVLIKKLTSSSDGIQSRNCIIEDYAFFGCQSLTTVNIENITSIGSMAFSKCNQLKSINTRDCEVFGVKSFEGAGSNNATSNMLTIDISSAKTIDDYTFANSGIEFNCDSKSSLAKIGKFAFSNLKNQSQRIYVPSSLLVVDEYAFACDNEEPFEKLTVSLPNANTICKNAFAGNKNGFNEIDVRNASNISINAFPQLDDGICENVIYSSNIKILKTDSFSCTNVKQISNLDNIEIVEKLAFKDSNIESLSLSKCNEIINYAFLNCKQLTRIELPACKRIRRDVFRNCSYLNELIAPNCSFIELNALNDTLIH